MNDVCIFNGNEFCRRSIALFVTTVETDGFFTSLRTLLSSKRHRESLRCFAAEVGHRECFHDVPRKYKAKRFCVLGTYWG